MNQMQGTFLAVAILIVLIIAGYLIFVRKPTTKFSENNTSPQDSSVIGLKTYVTPPEKTMGGNFRFQYYPDLYIYYDELGALKETDPKKHIIVLRHKRYQGIKAAGGDPKGFPLYEPVIEINNGFFHKCEDYTRCVEVQGILLGIHLPEGTSFQDSDLLQLFDEVVKSFEVLE